MVYKYAPQEISAISAKNILNVGKVTVILDTQMTLPGAAPPVRFFSSKFSTFESTKFSPARRTACLVSLELP